MMGQSLDPEQPRNIQWVFYMLHISSCCLPQCYLVLNSILFPLFLPVFWTKLYKLSGFLFRFDCDVILCTNRSLRWNSYQEGKKSESKYDMETFWGDTSESCRPATTITSRTFFTGWDWRMCFQGEFLSLLFFSLCKNQQREANCAELYMVGLHLGLSQATWSSEHHVHGVENKCSDWKAGAFSSFL